MKGKRRSSKSDRKVREGCWKRGFRGVWREIDV